MFFCTGQISLSQPAYTLVSVAQYWCLQISTFLMLCWLITILWTLPVDKARRRRLSSNRFCRGSFHHPAMQPWRRQKIHKKTRSMPNCATCSAKEEAAICWSLLLVSSLFLIISRSTRACIKRVGCVGWAFVRRWHKIDRPLRLPAKKRNRAFIHGGQKKLLPRRPAAQGKAWGRCEN